ncbi:hypothetical protein LCGC14_0146660 [marine sediment metagenome]|uniref:Uncharacterized protein n=1 Tax=marine sediment metagenome TaxID=412755 RepID=A0A0F9V3I5_9ZZZZ
MKKVVVPLTQQQLDFLHRKANELQTEAPDITVEDIIRALVDRYRLVTRDIVELGDDYSEIDEDAESEERQILEDSREDNPPLKHNIRTLDLSNFLSKKR